MREGESGVGEGVEGGGKGGDSKRVEQKVVVNMLSS